MTRLFHRGELQAALLEALRADGPSSGYALMRSLAERVGGGWRPSPGAVYPAVLGLEDAGLIVGRDVDGSRVYELSPSGRRAASARPGVLDDVAARASRRQQVESDDVTLGAVLDRFAARHARRGRKLGPAEFDAVEALLDDLQRNLDHITDQRRA